MGRLKDRRQQKIGGGKNTPRKCSVSNCHRVTKTSQREEDLYSEPTELSLCPLAVFPASYSRLPGPHVDALDGKITRTRSFEY